MLHVFNIYDVYYKIIDPKDRIITIEPWYSGVIRASETSFLTTGRIWTRNMPVANSEV